MGYHGCPAASPPPIPSCGSSQGLPLPWLLAGRAQPVWGPFRASTTWVIDHAQRCALWGMAAQAWACTLVSMPAGRC